MKNIKVLTTEAEIHTFMSKQWRTVEFRESHALRGFVWQIVQDFARIPRLSFEMTDVNLENAHFSSWWGAIPLRNYENDAIHDLYWLHEMTHAGRMIYIPNLEFSNWAQKLVENELEASVISEIVAYLEMPTLRAKSFPHTIYADRFLNDQDFLTRWKEDKARATKELMLRRRNVMVNQTPADETEFWIQRFSAQNQVWAGCWVHRYNRVETFMYELEGFSRAFGRPAAAARLLDWVTHNATTQGENIPFPDEAKAFAGPYWASRAIYLKAMEKAKTLDLLSALKG